MRYIQLFLFAFLAFLMLAQVVYAQIPVRVPAIYNIEGVSISVYYIDPHTVRVGVSNVVNATGVIVFELIDYYNASNRVTIEINASKGGYQDVPVWSNATVYYVTVFGRRYGPYIIYAPSWAPEVPEEVKPIIPFIPAAVLLALAGRGNARDAALGMIAFGALAPTLAVFGVSNIQVLSIVGPMAILLGALLYLVARE